MRRLKGLSARRSSFEIPNPTDCDIQTSEDRLDVVRIDSPPIIFSSPRNAGGTGIGDIRRSVDEHRAAVEGSRNAKLLAEYQQVLSIPGHLKSSVRGIASRRSSFSSSSDLQSITSARPSDASSVNCSATSSDRIAYRGRDVEQGRVIVVAFDANARGALVGAVAWAFLNVLKPGDEFVLVGVMDFIRGPLGYKCQVNDQTWLGANRKQLQDEIALKKWAWSSTPGLQTLCEERGVKLVVDVKPAQRPEVAIVQEAVTLGAVHVVLDNSLNNSNNRRQKYYLDRLNCDVTRMRRSGGVEILRSTSKEVPASPTSVIPPSGFLSRPPCGAAPAVIPSVSLHRDDEEELFTIDHCRPDARMSIYEGYESDDLFSICGDVGWRTSSFSGVLHQHPEAETQSAGNSAVAAPDHDPGSRLDKRLLSLTRLQLGD